MAQVINTINIPDGAFYISSFGNYVWVSSPSNIVYQIEKSNTPTVINTITVPVPGIPGISTLSDISAYGNYVWSSIEFSSDISRIDITDLSSTLITGQLTISGSSNISSDGNYVWVPQGNNVKQLQISTSTVINTIAVGNGPTAISSDGTYVWVVNLNDNSVSQIQITTSTVINTIAVGNNPISISSDGTYVWVLNNDDITFSVSQILIDGSNSDVINTIALVTSPPNTVNPNYISSNGTYLWVAFSGTNGFPPENGAVQQILIDNLTLINTIEVGKDPQTISSDGTYVWVANNYDSTVSQIQINAVCFKEDTKILTDKGYVKIQDLQKGCLIKTLLDGFKPIALITKGLIRQNKNECRVKDQLYKYTQENYPEIFEDLVITGGHSILLDSITEEIKSKQLKLIKESKLLIDNKYRLFTFLNEKSQLYEISGTHTIYHFALEGDYYKNYGVYANGLLVEASSQFFLKEASNMTLINL